MKKELKILFTVLFLMNAYLGLNAQNEVYQSIFTKNDKLIKDSRLYGSVLHQHQDFFNKAFSFQGFEGGILLNHKLFIGVYGSTFVSKLKAEISYFTSNVLIWQAGITVGRIYNEKSVLHSGWQIRAGYFSLKNDNSGNYIFMPSNSTISIGGMILSPELFAEINITKWMKVRTGLAYSFYSFEDQSFISKADLQNISIDFGFVFGKFN